MKIFIIGINGKMGKSVVADASDRGHSIAGGIDITAHAAYPVFKTADEVNVPYDVIIDFSRPQTLPEIIKLCEKSKKPVVLATTGYTDDDLKKIDNLAKKVAVFKSANMSLGVNVMASVVKAMTAALKGYDIEIIEAHHNQKVDAPSGTAKLLLDAVESSLDYTPDVVDGRVGDDCKRKPGEIGMHAIRGGTIVGEHTVMFAGTDEIIEIKHTALSRTILARGAVSAAGYILGKKPGIYNMDDCIKNS